MSSLANVMIAHAALTLIFALALGLSLSEAVHDEMDVSMTLAVVAASGLGGLFGLSISLLGARRPLSKAIWSAPSFWLFLGSAVAMGIIGSLHAV